MVMYRWLYSILKYIAFFFIVFNIAGTDQAYIHKHHVKVHDVYAQPDHVVSSCCQHVNCSRHSFLAK